MPPWRSDRLLGISTARKERAGRLGLPAAIADPHDYEPSPYGVLDDALLSISVEPEATTFVDIGAGKGRVMAEALLAGFRRVVGIEASPRLAEAAKDNLRAIEGAGRSEIRVADASEWALPDEPLLIYLFNPFGRITHDRFAARVEERIERCPADLWVVHYQPEHRDAWAAAPSLRCVEFEPRRMILRRSPGPGDTRALP